MKGVVECGSTHKLQGLYQIPLTPCKYRGVGHYWFSKLKFCSGGFSSFVSASASPAVPGRHAGIQRSLQVFALENHLSHIYSGVVNNGSKVSFR
jgi:hypothetical protein